MHVCLEPLILSQHQLPLTLHPRKARQAKTAFGVGHILGGPTYPFFLLCEYSAVPLGWVLTQLTLVRECLGGSVQNSPYGSREASRKKGAGLELVDHSLENCDFNICFLVEFLF